MSVVEVIFWGCLLPSFLLGLGLAEGIWALKQAASHRHLSPSPKDDIYLSPHNRLEASRKAVESLVRAQATTLPAQASPALGEAPKGAEGHSGSGGEVTGFRLSMSCPHNRITSHYDCPICNMLDSGAPKA